MAIPRWALPSVVSPPLHSLQSFTASVFTNAPETSLGGSGGSGERPPGGHRGYQGVPPVPKAWQSDRHLNPPAAFFNFFFFSLEN